MNIILFVKKTEEAFDFLLRHLPKTKRPTTTEALYSEVGRANPNLRPGVDEAPQKDTRSIRFDVNAERIEKEVDEVTKPSPNERLLRHLKVLRRTPNMTRRRQPLPDQSIS